MGLLHGPVDHAAEALLRQGAEVLELLLPDVAEESGDLGIVDQAHQGDALPGGEDQGVEAHGDHGLHPGEGADDGAGAAGVIQEVVGDGETVRRDASGAGVQVLLHREEDRGEAVGLIGVGRGGADGGGGLLKARPAAQGKAEVAAAGRDPGPEEDAVGLILRGGGEGQGRVGSEEDPGLGDAHGLELRLGVRLPQGDDVHAVVQGPGGHAAVFVPCHRADAAAVHLHPAAQGVGGADVIEIVPEGAAGGDILDEAAAAVDVKDAFPHGVPPGEDMGAVDGADPVGEAGGGGVLGEDGHRHVRVQGAHLLEDGVQNGVVPGVAPAVGPADHHAVPGFLLPMAAAEDLLIDVELGVHGLLDGEVPGGLFKELFPHVAAEGVVIAQGRQALAQGLGVPGGEEVAADILVDEVGDAAHGGGHGGQVEAGALGEGVGEGLGEGGEGVDVQGGVEAVHAAADPAGEGDLVLYPQFLCQFAQLLPLLAVPGDDQPEAGAVPVGQGEAPDQGGHVLHGVQSGGDAHHHAVLVRVRPQGAEVGEAVPLGRGGGEVDAVVDGVEAVGGEAPGDEEVHHGV